MRVCLSVSLVLIGVSFSAWGQNPPTHGKAEREPATIGATGIQSIDRVAETQAALVTEFEVNGLKVLFKRRAGGMTVSAGLFLRGGVRNVTRENAGVESLMLSVATEASLNFPRERMRAELARMGTAIGSGANPDYSVVSLGTPRVHFDRAWRMFVDVALSPSFDKQDVELMRSRVISSLNDDTDDPDSHLQQLHERVAYVGHPYANRPRGTVESVTRLTSEDLRAYHQKMMQTSRLLLVVVGDLDVNDLKQKVAAAFGKLAVGSYKSDLPPQLAFSSSTIEVTPRDLATNYVQGDFVAPTLTSPDIDAMRIASTILRERVFDEVRAKRNLSYAPSAFLSSQGANIGGIYVSAVDANQAVRVMLDEIRRLKNEPIRPSDISAVAAQYLTSYYLGQETNAAQAGELAQYELIGGGWRNSVQVIDKLRAVSPADVQRVARIYMKNLRFVVLGNPSQIDRSVFTAPLGQ